MTLTSSMNIAQQALLVNQAALNVVSNNIANMNTEGYSRQRVDLSPSVNYTPIGGSVLGQVYSSSGVELDGIQRYSDFYLQSYYQQQNSTYAYLNQYSQIATNIESMMNELKGTGIEKTFTAFYEAVTTLSQNPSDSVARTNFIQQAQAVADKFNTLSSNLSTLRTSIVGDVNVANSLDGSKVSLAISDVNNKLKQIAEINADIVRVSSGNMVPNNLLDKRDQLITELSEMVPVDVNQNSNGTVSISINGVNIVKGTELLGNLEVNSGTEANPAIISIVNTDGDPISGDINKFITSGTVGAMLDLGGSKTNIMTVKGVLDNLDKLAAGFAEIINGIQTNVTADGSPMAIDKNSKELILATENIFESSDGNPIKAGNIKINDDVLNNPYLIAAARVDTTAADYNPKAIGNNSNMQSVLATRNGTYNQLGNTSPEGFLANVVGEIGLQAENASTKLKNQTAILEQVQNQLKSATGVNIDEELIDLTKYQRAYQASARIFSVCSDLMDLLVRLGQ